MEEAKRRKATLQRLKNLGLIEEEDFSLLNKELDDEIAELRKKLKEVRRKIADNDIEGILGIQ